MLENDSNVKPEERMRASEDRLRLGEATSGFASFGLDLDTGNWDWSPQAAHLFGFDPARAGRSIAKWHAVFVDDIPKIEAAIDAAIQTGAYIGSLGRVTLRILPLIRCEELFTRLPSGRRLKSDY
jgi:hypothetical protein